MNYTSGQVQRTLGLSAEALRLWVLDLEAVLGEPLPRDERNSRRFSSDVVTQLSRAVAWQRQRPNTERREAIRAAVGQVPAGADRETAYRVEVQAIRDALLEQTSRILHGTDGRVEEMALHITRAAGTLERSATEVSKIGQQSQELQRLIAQAHLHLDHSYSNLNRLGQQGTAIFLGGLLLGVILALAWPHLLDAVRLRLIEPFLQPDWLKILAGAGAGVIGTLVFLWLRRLS